MTALIILFVALGILAYSGLFYLNLLIAKADRTKFQLARRFVNYRLRGVYISWFLALYLSVGLFWFFGPYRMVGHGIPLIAAMAVYFVLTMWHHVKLTLSPRTFLIASFLTYYSALGASLIASFGIVILFFLSYSW